MDKYKVIKLAEKLQLMAHDTIVKLYKKDKKMLNDNDLDFILKELNKSNKNKKFTYLFRGRNRLLMTTIKGFKHKTFPILDDDNDYLNQYYYLEITLRKAAKVEDNKQEMSMKSKESEYVKKYNAEYYNRNKATILQKGKEKLKCATCDCDIRKENIHKHNGTRKHKQNEKINKMEQDIKPKEEV